ncbi:MAG TPA: EAL domain-containing protein [Thiobacillaceae bacterium]|nr:EAL domain-containing protein [Thiobacillaceae bacterium]
MRRLFEEVSISTLSAAFIVVVALLVAGMGAHMWVELQNASASIRAREAAAGRKEISQATHALAQRMRDISANLAGWDETRQQLVFDEYYTLWRDVRLKDARIVPSGVVAAALYHKGGDILIPDREGRMPARLPAAPPILVHARESGHDYLYSYFPVHADPDRAVLLGYGAIKFDFLAEMRTVQSFRYTDISTLSVAVPGTGLVPLENLAARLKFSIKANPDVEALHKLFLHAYGRQLLATLLVLAVAAWFTHRVLVRPLRLMSEEIKALQSAGGTLPSAERLTGPVSVLELADVRRAFNDHQRRLAEMHRNLEQSNQDFYDQARRDALSGAFNRRAFEEDWLELGQVGHCRGCNLLLFDCDHFKAINDTYGHPVGDAVIVAIAACLRQALRAGDRLYRIGGDEFATMLRDTPLRMAEAIAERCLEHILVHDFQQYGVAEPVTISIGLAHADSEEGLSELQKQADLAMYTAKRPGNRKIVVYDESIGQVSALVANREVSLVFQAIRLPQLLEFRYQPIMRLPDPVAEYVEALARIRLDGELIGPAAIFPIVQARRLDSEFDLAVIAAIRRDLDLDLPALARGVSINISAPGLLNTKVIQALEALKAAYPARKVVIEITETALITQMGPAVQHIERLRLAGCLVALDDFGSGYSSLRYLAAMPVDLVKFDISLVHQLRQEGERPRKVVEDIARMVLNAGYELVAEGIETRELLDKVTEMGFSHAQGFYFSDSHGQPPAG